MFSLVLLFVLSVAFVVFYYTFYRHLMPKKGRIEKVYKKAWSTHGTEAIVTLEIPEYALRYQELGKAHRFKCRASEAKVLSITELSTGNPLSSARSGWDHLFTYKPGDTVKPRYFADACYGACASGIHFFIQRSKAVSYGRQ